MLPPAPTPRRRLHWFLAALLVLGAAGAGGWFVYQNGYLATSNPADYADPEGVFTATFPNPPAATPVAVADPKMLRWGERGAKAAVGRREYAVTVLDGLNRGDQEIGPATRDEQARDLLVLLAVNSNGDSVHSRTLTHDGHSAREVVIADRDDGKVMAVRVVVGEKCAVRMTVQGRGDKGNPEAVLNEAAGFFDAVKLSPAFGPPILEDPIAVSAAELAETYKSDPAAADGRFKGHWLRVTGKVTETGDGTFDVDPGVAVRRAAPARKSVPVRKGSPVTASGKCEGLADGRVTLTEAIVLPSPGSQPQGVGPGSGPPMKR